MTLYTPLSGLPYPQPTDTANLPLHLQSLATGIDSRTILRYSNAADRDEAVTTPVAGMVAWLTTPGTLTYYTGTQWIALGAWNTYTPTWTAATTNPSIGDGTLTGKYAVVGKVCHFTTLVTFSSTTTYGSGAYTLGLPVTAGAQGGLPQFLGIATVPGGRVLLACQPTLSTGATGITLWGVTSETNLSLLQVGSGGVLSTAWSATSAIRISGTYEVA